jgi:hypothetical protein
MSHGSPPVSKLPSSRTRQQLQLHFGIGEPWRVVLAPTYHSGDGQSGHAPTTPSDLPGRDMLGMIQLLVALSLGTPDYASAPAARSPLLGGFVGIIKVIVWPWTISWG